MRVRIDPAKHNPADEPEFVVGGMMGDDFCIDETAGVAYVTTRRENTIDRVSLEPNGNSDRRHSVAGDPFTEELIGPSAVIGGAVLGNAAGWCVFHHRWWHEGTHRRRHRSSSEGDARKVLVEGRHTPNPVETDQASFARGHWWND